MSLSNVIAMVSEAPVILRTVLLLSASNVFMTLR